jgi:hypothetical protein
MRIEIKSVLMDNLSVCELGGLAVRWWKRNETRWYGEKTSAPVKDATVAKL